jgi:ribosomal protein S12 methylthiotransferase accessory factor
MHFGSSKNGSLGQHHFSVKKSILRNPSISLATLKDGPEVPLSECLERAGRIVSDRVGIISKVDFEELVPNEPEVYSAHSEPANVSVLCGQEALNHGDAASINPDRAIIKAVGESIERYCSGQYDVNDLVLTTFEEIEGEAVDPNTFSLYSDKQYSQEKFPFSPITPRTPLRWSLGHSLRDDIPRWVPAAFVYVPYLFDDPREKSYFNPISTGLACGPDIAWALYKSILEVIERDTFMIVWKNKLSVPRLDPWSSKDPFVQQLLEVLDDVSLDCEVLYLTTNIKVPVIIVILKNSRGIPYTTMGIGADLDPNRALTQALEEAYLTFLGMNRYAKFKKDFKPESDFNNIKTPTLHALAHAVCPELRSSLKFLTSSNTQLSFDALPNLSSESKVENVKTLVNMLADKGFDVISYDLTTLDIDEVGFKVVRSVIPGMQPLDINHSRRYEGGKRLYEVPVQMGIFEKPLCGEDLNVYPHPFP